MIINEGTRYSSVMLIDDNEIDNFIHERMLRGCSFTNRVYINSSAGSALDFLKNISLTELQDSFYPDIIFLDINMPIMDGFMFIEEFEKIKIKNKDTRIVLLTSSINPEDEQKSKKYSVVNKFLKKPLTEDVLHSI